MNATINPVEDLIQRARDAKITMKAICARAKVAQSTVSRSRQGGDIKLKTLQKLETALTELAA